MCVYASGSPLVRRNRPDDRANVRAQLAPPRPELVCIDLQAYTTTQAPERADILNVGGFSDAVFSVVAAFLADDTDRFVADVEKVEL